jgi:hypothetical protein
MPPGGRDLILPLVRQYNHCVEEMSYCHAKAVMRHLRHRCLREAVSMRYMAHCDGGVCQEMGTRCFGLEDGFEGCHLAVVKKMASLGHTPLLLTSSSKAIARLNRLESCHNLPEILYGHQNSLENRGSIESLLV